MELPFCTARGVLVNISIPSLDFPNILLLGQKFGVFFLYDQGCVHPRKIINEDRDQDTLLPFHNPHLYFTYLLCDWLKIFSLDLEICYLYLRLIHLENLLSLHVLVHYVISGNDGGDLSHCYL